MELTKIEYMEKIVSFCNQKKYTYEIVDDFAIKISTRLEKWILFIKGNGDTYEKTALHHFNYFQKKHKRFERFPDYHLQFERYIKPEHLIDYVERHDNKWNIPLYPKRNLNSTKNSVKVACN